MVSGARPFDPYAVGLNGVNLIEASAGTGKTWTISLLYLRLLVESDLRVDEILTVTYTKAATAELKQRIRDLLEKMRRALETGEVPPGDSLVEELKSRFSVLPEAPGKIARALRDFDQAAIFTIHSFCQRVLSEQPLESGGSLEAELQPDDSFLLRETADDFWRLRMARLDPLPAAYLAKKKITPEKLLKGIRSYLGKPEIELPPASATGLDASGKACLAAWENACGSWSGGGRDAVVDYLRCGALHKGWYPPEKVDAWTGLMDSLLGAGNQAVPLMGKEENQAVEKFSTAKIKGAVKGKAPMPPLAFPPLAENLFSANKALVSCLDQWLLDQHVELLRYLNAELPRKKECLRVMSYGDLLTRLRDALDRDPKLAGRIAENYRAALIDEFQDTDPVQYEIFRKVFLEPRRTVFLVGDPKQAIYSFRGADVFTYLAARESVAEPLPLIGNHRSTGRMVGAVNKLFEGRTDAFVLDRIPFHPSTCESDPAERLAAPDEDRPPFRVWFVDGKVKDEKKGNEPLNKEEAEDLAVKATATEIVRLLAAGDRKEITIPSKDGARSLRGSDVAVLVPTNWLGTMVRKKLRRLGVACVQHSQDNVFESDEARDVETVLRAVAEPGREDLVKAALVTDLLGVGGRDLYDLGLDDEEWGKTLAWFQECHTRWLRRGFMPMFRRLMRDRGVAARLLAWSDGERRLTNVHHLAELVHAASAGIGRAPDRMVDWLSMKRAEGARNEEESLLRLESDEQLVNIVTVHSSKGLQYPVVFLPFAWYVRDPKRNRTVGITWHDPDLRFKERLDVSPGDEVRAAAGNEDLAGRVRELYVAVTRARFRCYLAHGHVNGADGSALSHLLGSHPGKEILEELAAGSKGSLSVDPIPREEASRYAPLEGPAGTREPRHFPRATVDQAWRVTSYSGLTMGAKEAPAAALEELPDHDQDAVEKPEPEEQQGPRIPRGSRIGSCLHSLFEELDFAEANAHRVEDLAAEKLRGFGFPENLAGPVADLVNRALDTRLDADGAIRLRDIDSRRRLNEMGFHYPVKGLDGAGLLRVLREQGLRMPFVSALERVKTDTVDGFMKGFIDLVFEAGGRYHLADYKSNRLDGYGEAELTAEMTRSFYFLQYLLYAVALHRYLGARLTGYDYDRHFGGVYYLFLRGMEPASPGSGVFADRPSRALVEALDSCLGEERP